MLRAARVKFVTVTMFILLGIFIIMGAATYGLIHNRIVMSADATFGEIIIKVKPGSLESVEVPRAAVLRISASGQENIIFDAACFTEESVMELYDQAVAAGEDRGQIGNVYYSIVEKDESTIFIAADRTIEKNFEDQSVTFTVLVLAGAYLALFFIVWGFSYLVMKPVQNAFIQQNRFISDASHELKTPLSIISASADVLALEQDNEYIDNIRAQSRRMNSLISDLLSLAKMDETKALLDKSEQNVSAIISKCALQFDALAFERNKEIVTDFEPNIVIACDRDSVEKIATILIDNALKYADDDKIYLSLKKSGDNKAVFTAYNRSNTISIDAKEKIFDRFYRADNSRNRETGGSGLGLSIAKKIADINKWKISASVEDKKSVTFTLVF